MKLRRQRPKRNSGPYTDEELETQRVQGDSARRMEQGEDPAQMPTCRLVPKKTGPPCCSLGLRGEGPLLPLDTSASPRVFSIRA